MAKLTNRQMEHVEIRIKKIRDTLIGAAPVKPDEDDPERFWTDVERGKITITDDNFRSAVIRFNAAKSKWGYGPTLDEKIHKEYFRIENETRQAEYEKQLDKYTEMCAIVDTEVERIRDQLMLGEQEEALRMLTRFQDFKRHLQ